jgi:hypothetical protein
MPNMNVYRKDQVQRKILVGMMLIIDVNEIVSSKSKVSRIFDINFYQQKKCVINLIKNIKTRLILR